MESRTQRVVVVGAGFGGIGMGIRLRQAGINDFLLLESASDVGGTWRDNTYPGCACDVPAALYSLSFAPWGGWTRRYPAQAELHAYLRDCVDRFGLRPHLRLGVTFRSARHEAGLWHIETNHGSLRAENLVLALGTLRRPALPAIAGLESFAGPVFHTARWDHGVDLTGKSVGVIGTGASAAQLVPELAKTVAALTLFQRSANWILPKRDPPRRFPALSRLTRLWEYWSHEVGALAFVVFPRLMAVAERHARGYAKRHLADDGLRERLTPDYRMGCKRVLLSSDFLPAMEWPGMRLVTEPIAEITPDGARTADGARHRFDILVLATGFQATDAFAEVAISGRDGVTLAERWRDGMRAWMGMALPDFPNLFLLGGPHSGLGHNSVVFMLETQIGHILRRLRMGGVHEVTRAAEARFQAWLDRRMKRTVWLAGCRAWYLDRNGRNTTLWPASTISFWLRAHLPRPFTYRRGTPNTNDGET
jgi:cation diffusion facilitator CzcD-associated flavoprotein CzcO